MKLWVYESDNGSVVFSNRPKDFGMVFIGTLDLDIKHKKKWVERQVVNVPSYWFIGTRFIKQTIPNDARNIKLTYEVEE